MISDTKSARQPTEHLSGAEVIVKALQDQGVDVVFGYPGGAVLPLYDELFKTNKLRHILVRHEQAAVHAAEGYARSTGKIGGIGIIVTIEKNNIKIKSTIKGSPAEKAGLLAKDEILEMYFNSVYFGSIESRPIWGVQRASKMIFVKDVSELKLHEGA